MALTHRLDTSIVIRFGRPGVRAIIAPITMPAEIGRAGITDQVGYGSRNGQEWVQDMADLSVFQLVEPTADHQRRARHVQRLLTLRSQRGRKVPNLLIAAAAEQAELTLDIMTTTSSSSRT